MADDVQRALGRIEGKIDGLAEDVGETKQAVSDLDGRLRAVEKKAAINSSVVSAVTAISVSALAFKLRSFFGS